MESKGLFVKLRDLVVTSKGLFVRSRYLFVIFNSTNGININSHLLLPINRALELGGENFWLFVHLIHLFNWLAFSLLPLSIICSGFPIPTKAKSVLHNEAGYSLCSSFKAKSGPSLIHGRRNFSSGPPGTKNIPKMDSGTKVTSELGTGKRSCVEGDSDSSKSRLKEIADIIGVCGLIFHTYNCVMTFYYAVQIHRSIKALDKVE
ncbi:hypothetical protein SETIT_4G258400v2 [Setaria italica]|uniref:Uncharacterized protein n=2 Tax=Setaria italica TaxID=4555 RepID=A0A368R062_SETIT|nr:uncharacterized protein LOC105914284 [Setaria italica]RCV22920.1 hypothetical protein SETIT_4G258400v2 [Setaria italica]